MVAACLPRGHVVKVSLPLSPRSSSTPQDVAVQAGATPATVQVSWRPPALTATGLSNGANVTGYGVYAKGQRVSFLSGGAHPGPWPQLTTQRGVTLPLSSSRKTHQELLSIPSTLSPQTQLQNTENLHPFLLHPLSRMFSAPPAPLCW